jgi:thiol-disulfide isomerase/thioredoxin
LAPDLAIHMADGSTTRLGSLKGKPVIMAFLNTGCSHCQHFAGQLSVYQKEFGPKGLRIVAVVFDTAAKQGLANFRDRYVSGYPVGYSDEATVMAWLKQPVEQGYFVPIVAFVDRQGRIISQHLGDDMLFQDPDANMRRKIAQLLK